MFKITLDMYSGRPNPSWVVSGPEAEAVLRQAAQAGVLAHAAPMGGLGYRGARVELLSDRAGLEYGLPSSFSMAVPGTASGTAGIEIVHRALAAAMPDALGGDTSRFLQDQVATASAAPALHTMSSPADGIATLDAPAAAPLGGCIVESTTFNPGFWNDPAYQTHNNCYAYASNQRLNTFPPGCQPGRGTGHQYTAFTAAAVSAAAKSDGAHDVNDCFGDDQKPRWLVALVIWPGQDYHWYRHSAEGFWGHKPGQTPARNVDDSNKVISDPRTCNRGNYSIFYGFMILPRSLRIA